MEHFTGRRNLVNELSESNEVGCFDVRAIRVDFHPPTNRSMTISTMHVVAGSEVDEPGKLRFDRPSLLVELLKRDGEPMVIVVAEFVQECYEHMIDSTSTHNKKQ